MLFYSGVHRNHQVYQLGRTAGSSGLPPRRLWHGSWALGELRDLVNVQCPLGPVRARCAGMATRNICFMVIFTGHRFLFVYIWKSNGFMLCTNAAQPQLSLWYTAAHFLSEWRKGLVSISHVSVGGELLGRLLYGSDEWCSPLRVMSWFLYYLFTFITDEMTTLKLKSKMLQDLMFANDVSKVLPLICSLVNIEGHAAKQHR